MFIQPMLPVIIPGAAFFLLSIVMLSLPGKTGRYQFSWGTRAVAALMLMTAGFRPSAQSVSPSESYNNRYNVYFVVDLTSSMAAEDWAEGDTRLDGVREDINNLLDDYAGAKFSLITFSSYANVRTPLTPDSSALASAVNTVLPEITQYSSGSSISTPKELLEKTLQAEAELDPENERANIVLYFGDGEQTVEAEPESFASVSEYVSSAKVYGYGTEQGGKMKEQTGIFISGSKEPSYITDASGQEGISVIDEDNLKKIADELGGTYEYRTADEPINPAILSDADKIELEKKEESNINNTVEYYWVPLIPFLLIMLVEAGLLLRRASRLGVKR